MKYLRISCWLASKEWIYFQKFSAGRMNITARLRLLRMTDKCPLLVAFILPKLNCTQHMEPTFHDQNWQLFILGNYIKSSHTFVISDPLVWSVVRHFKGRPFHTYCWCSSICRRRPVITVLPLSLVDHSSSSGLNCKSMLSATMSGQSQVWSLTYSFGLCSQKIRVEMCALQTHTDKLEDP